MNSKTTRRFAGLTLALVALGAFAGVASAAQPTMTTHTITMLAASETAIDLPRSTASSPA